VTVVFRDLFTEASDTAIASHTADLGGGWTLSSGNVQVGGGLGYVRDGPATGGHRARITTALSVLEYDVAADVSIITNSGFRFAGLSGRRDPAGGYEFKYDCSGAQWTLDNSGTSSNLSEAWPGNPTALLLQIRTATKKGFVGGVEKVSLSDDENGTDGYYAGIIVGDFSGAAAGDMRIDNFTVDDLAAASSVVPVLMRQYRQRGS
jgi:hypothetical protein